jgi:hypothetical protein
MQNPEPPNGWKPTNSTLGGAIFGAAVGQIVVAVCGQIFHSPLTPEVSSAVTTVCIGVIGYFFPDGGRRN